MKKSHPFLRGLEEVLRGVSTTHEFTRDLLTQALNLFVEQTTKGGGKKDIDALITDTVEEVCGTLEFVDSQRCRGIKVDGKQCSRTACLDGYCGFHQSQRRDALVRKRRLDEYTNGVAHGLKKTGSASVFDFLETVDDSRYHLTAFS